MPRSEVNISPVGRVLRGMAVACLSVALLTFIKFGVKDVIGEPTPFLLYFVAVVVAAWSGGLPAGIFATVVAGLVANFLFIDRGVTAIPTRREIAPLVVFCSEGLAIAWVTARLQRERLAAARAEAEARATAGKLDAVLDGVGDGITVQDPQGKVIYANQAAAQITGFRNPGDFVGAAPGAVYQRFEILREDGSPLPPDELPGRRALAGGDPDEMLVRFRMHGRPEDHFSIVRASPVRDAHGDVLFAVNIFRDVTHKRARDEEVRLAREWFSTALRSIGDAVITTDRQGHVTFMNPIAEDLTGWRHAEALGRPLREVFVILHERTREPAESPVDRVLREGKIVGLANHTVLVDRRGNEVAIDDSAAPIRSDAGELVGVVLVFRDVQAKRRDEERRNFLARATAELNRSLDYEATLATVARLAVPAIADWCAVDVMEGGERRRLGIAHIDPAKLEFVAEIERRYPPDPNAATGVPNILRTGQAEMIPEIPGDLIEVAARDAEHLRLIRQLALRSYLGVPIKAGGRVIGAISFVMAESRRIYDGADLELARALADRASVAIDNALLYRAAEKSRRDAANGRDRLETLILSAPMAILVVRGDQLVVDMYNDPYRKMNPGVVLGRRIRDVATDQKNVENLERVYRTGEPFSVVAREVRPRGPGPQETLYVDYTAQPLRDHNGTIDAVVVFAHDVTEQVLAQKRVERARAEAEAASRSKDEFLAMLGHELRNPLAPILTALQLMTLRGDGAHDHERQIIERQVKHVVRLVDDLLDVSRITRGKVALERERVELAEVVADAIEIASPLLEQGRHVLETELPRTGLPVSVDRTRMAQVIANLLTNSAKYTEAGGRIEIHAAAEGDKVVLRVRDSGVGISPEMLPRVFDLFVQEQQTIERSRGGLGLGLTIVKNLVSLHGGEVSAYSAGLGHGSEFVITLPLAAPEATSAAAPVDGVALASGSERHVRAGSRILIVDDNEDAADMLSMVLEARGYATRVAHDGPSALTAAAEFRPETALLDIGLPVMDGFELARRLRADPAHGGLRLIALTGYGQETDRKRSREAGFDHHLVKPIDVKSVVAILETPHPVAK